jgi:hypothetical protein
MDTDGLIDQLAANATPVRPLPGPWKRTGLWLAIALPYVALVVILMSPRPDLAMQLADPRFQVEQVAALATAILAAAAAFTCVVSGRSRAICLLPLIPLAVWLASLGSPLFPGATLALAGLAVGALAQAGMQVYHAGDISLMVLVWHLGSVAVLAAVAGWIGRWVLRWPVPAAVLRRPASGSSG